MEFNATQNERLVIIFNRPSQSDPKLFVPVLIQAMCQAIDTSTNVTMNVNNQTELGNPTSNPATPQQIYQLLNNLDETLAISYKQMMLEAINLDPSL